MFIFSVIRKGIPTENDLVREDIFSTSNSSFGSEKPPLQNEELFNENKRLKEDKERMIMELQDCRFVIDEIDEDKNYYRFNILFI